MFIQTGKHDLNEDEDGFTMYKKISQPRMHSDPTCNSYIVTMVLPFQKANKLTTTMTSAQPRANVDDDAYAQFMAALDDAYAKD